MADRSETEEVLAELQFSFACFLVGMNYDRIERWKKLEAMFCNCDEALVKHNQLFLNFISDLYFQMIEVPDDFFVDIVSSNNFLVSSLSCLFTNIRNNVAASKKLKDKAERFESSISKRFDWDFSAVDQEDEPVIVDLGQTSEQT